MNQTEATEILEKTLSFARADAALVRLTATQEATTRFADSAITQNVEKSDTSVVISVAFGQSCGTATTNDLADDSLRAAVRRAEAIAKLSPPDPEYMPPVEAAEAKKYVSPKVYAEDPELLNPMARAEAIATAAKTVKEKGYRFSGAMGGHQDCHAIANSAGLRGFFRCNRADMHATVLTPTGSGWAETIANRSADVDASGIAKTALEIAARAENPSGLEPGKYTLILQPPAVAELLLFLFMGGFDGKATDEGRTFLRDKLGTRVFGEQVNLRSNPADKVCPGIPFSADGLVSPTLHWIRNGVVEQLIDSRFWARKTGRTATGYPANIIMDGGNETVEQMVGGTEKGLLATRFWYVRFIDPMGPTVTGMTRDGLFLIENGKLTRPLKHLRFNVNLVEVFNHIEAMGSPERTGEFFDMLAPPLKVRDFNFSSTTAF